MTLQMLNVLNAKYETINATNQEVLLHDEIYQESFFLFTNHAMFLLQYLTDRRDNTNNQTHLQIEWYNQLALLFCTLAPQPLFWPPKQRPLDEAE
jgi:hypothetical protein